jgi:glycine reductase
MEGYFTPTLLHPNELFDGSVVSANYRNFFKTCTFLQQNNYIALQLLRRHGKDLNFVGHIIGRGHFDDLLMKERQGQYAAKLARLLSAQAAVLTMEGGGNAYIDYMLTVRALEQSGIAAVPTVTELGGPKGEDYPLVFVVPEAVSIVTGGNTDSSMQVPAVDRVIGGERVKFADGVSAFKPLDASSSFFAKHNNFYCGYWQMKVRGMTAVDY